MGRKSSAKKKRKIPEQKHDNKHAHKHVQKIEKELTANGSKPSPRSLEPLSTPKPKEQLHPQKIFGGLLALIMATLLIVVGVNLLQKNFRPTPIAELVPASKTSAIIEINTYADHTQLTKAIKLLEKTEYSDQKIKDLINKKLKISVDFDIVPWLGRQIGAVELEVEKEKELSTVFFLESTSEARAVEFLNKTAKENLTELKETVENNQKMYSWNLRDESEDRTKDIPMYSSFLGDYLILSKDQAAVKMLIANTEDTVSGTDEYSDVESKMPFNKIGFLFMNYDVAHDKLLQKYNSISGLNLYTLARSPFKKLSKSEGASLIAKDQNFIIESFILLKEPYLKGNSSISSTRKYNANLLNVIPENVSFIWGGEEIKTHINRMVSLLSEGAANTATMFEGVMKNYTEKYFGKNVSLEDDIYPLLENEFLISMTKKGQNDIYTFVIELSDPTNNALAIQKIANNFASVGGVFEPHVQEVTLGDGTKAKEIVATPQELIKSESEYKDSVIYEMRTKEGKWGLYYSILDGKVIISTNRDALLESLKLALKETTNSAKNSSRYLSVMSPALNISDSLIYADIGSLSPEAKLIKSISMAQNYYSNGLLSDYILNVE